MQYLTDTITYNGDTYKVTWLPEVPYQQLSPITQAFGFCFNDQGELLVQTHDNIIWQVMGGTIEPGETPEKTLIREIDEEVNVDIDPSTIKYLGAQKVEDKHGNVFYQLRYAAKIEKMKPRKPDPDRGIVRPRKFIDPKEYGKISTWGEIGQEITRLAMIALEIEGD